MKIIHGFERITAEHIRELQTSAELYRHIKTGAELLSLINKNENKVFAITFRTPPTDSTGLAHILEPFARRISFWQGFCRMTLSEKDFFLTSNGFHRRKTVRRLLADFRPSNGRPLPHNFG